MERSLTTIRGLPNALVEAMGEGATVKEALQLDLSELAYQGDVDLSEAIDIRRALLRVHTDGEGAIGTSETTEE